LVDRGSTYGRDETSIGLDITLGNHKGKRSFVRPRDEAEYNIRIVLEEIRSVDKDLTQLA
jgi:hypothetical protein